MKMQRFPKLEFPVPGSKTRIAQNMRLAELGADMQTAGWRVDRDACLRHQAEAAASHQKYTQKLEELTGLTGLFKGAQTDSVRNYFWDELKVPVVSRSKTTKKRKLDGPALVTYAFEHADPHVRACSAALYALRKNWKKMEYMTSYLAASAEDGRVHPRWNAGGTKTGRWSCTDPNLQQVSSRSPTFDFGDGAGKQTLVTGYKDCFVADEGFVLVDADYAALELYLQTYIAQEPKLIQYILEGRDLHMINARVMLGAEVVPPAATKSSHKAAREVGKLAYGFAYNASEDVTQVAKQMRQKLPMITTDLVEIMRKRYFLEYPAFPAWQRRTIEQINTVGFVELPISGARLYTAPNTRGYNQALNGVPQGTGADRVNLAALRLWPQLRWSQGEQLRGQIHDSLVGQTRPEWITEFSEKLVEAMTYPIKIFGVEARFVAEPGVGYNWADMITVPDWLDGKRP